MQIANREIKQEVDVVEVSALVDGFRLSYRLPKSYPVSRTGDPFLAAALLPAMLQGEKLEVDPSLTVSPQLLDNVELLQEIHHYWNPVLKKIPVVAHVGRGESVNAGVVSFFSGGVDSMYTFLKRAREMSHAVYIHGFDFQVDGPTLQSAVQRHAAFLREFDKTLISVETNHYTFGYRYNLSRNLTQGSALASVALLLGFPRVFVPASTSFSYLFPLGSHPLTDPLYSNGSVAIIHDGAEATRAEKVRRIAGCGTALANLRVCFHDMNVNCGKCEKCLRTMIALRLVRASGAPFPPLPSIRTIREMRIRDNVEMMFLKEDLELATEMNEREMIDALKSCIRRQERKCLLRDADRLLLGGLARRLYRRVVPVKETQGVPRIATASPERSGFGV